MTRGRGALGVVVAVTRCCCCGIDTATPNTAATATTAATDAAADDGSRDSQGYPPWALADADANGAAC